MLRMTTKYDAKNSESLLEPAKLLVCKLPDDGTDIRIMRSLLKEKNVTRVTSVACRAAINLQSARTRSGKLPEPILGRVMTIVVTESESDDVFDFIRREAQIGQPGRGVLMQTSLLGATRFSLPDDVPLEE